MSPPLSLLLVLSISFAAQAHGQERHTRHSYTPTEYLKNYALIACLGNAYSKDKEMQRDLADAASAYQELGSFDLAAYEEAFYMSQTFLAKRYQGKDGEKLTAMKCVDFFHSKELEKLARKYSRKNAGKK